MLASITLPHLAERAPNFSLQSHNGDKVSLSDYYGNKHVVLFFVRTYTCYACREHVKHLARLHKEFKKAGAEVLVILNGSQQDAAGYADITQAPFPVLADTDYHIYESYGLTKHFVLSTRTASVIVDKNGDISYMKSAANPWGWRTETENLLAHLRELNGQ